MQTITGSISTYVFTIRRSRPLFLALYRAPGLMHEHTWQAVHGMIEAGEKAYEAALREMTEETALAPQRFFKTDFVESFYSEHTDAVHLVPAFAAFVDGEPSVGLCEEHVKYEWCDLDDVVSRFVWPSQRQAVRIIAEASVRWPEIGHGMTEISQLVSLDGSSS
jgi:dATP pyrophosphohydrolase